MKTEILLHKEGVVVFVINYFRPPDRQAIATKTSLAGLPSAIPSRPLKENKARVIPKYIKKARQGKNYYIIWIAELDRLL